MALNKFNLFVFLQIIGIAGVAILISLTLEREYMQMTSAGLVILWLGQILFLNFYINRIHRDVYKFMEALKNQDTAQLFNRRKPGTYFKNLYTLFNEITRNFRLVRIEKEAENQFFRETIRQSSSGLLALSDDGSIVLINEAALRILGMEEVSGIAELSDTHPDLSALFNDPEPGDCQVNLLAGRKKIQLAVKVSLMNLQEKRIRMFSLLDISNEMVRSEVEAWQKLIRVLNHEITNSISPIHILSTSLLDLFQKGSHRMAPEQVDEHTIDQTVLGLKTLVKRSSGLADFLNTYKSFSEPGEPEYTEIDLEDLLERIHSLLGGELDRAGVRLSLEVSPPGLRLLADEKLIEQCLINLVKNSIYALEGRDQARISMHAGLTDQKTVMEVCDNGKGIPETIIDHIFTPFFTTRKGGSGIGLSLVRQIMLMHKGSISVDSRKGEMTCFTLTF
jgi:nitrogen fixation/metabolism regulation signal transduction histidine kinase